MSLPWLGVWLLLVFPPVIWAVGAQQRLQKLRRKARSSLRELRLLLYKRYDLLPHLAEALRGYLKHEREQVEQLVVLRGQAIQALDDLHAELEKLRFASLPILLNCEALIRQQLTALAEVIESQADAAGDPAIQRWLEQLAALIEPLLFAQQMFNHAVERHNHAVKQIPARGVAWLYRYHPIQVFTPESVRLSKL